MSAPEDQSHLPPIGSHAQAWMQFFEAHLNLEATALGTDPTDPARQAASDVLLQMEFYEDDPRTKQELQDLVDFQAPLSDAPEHLQIEQRRSRLESLLANTAMHNDVINPQTIQAKLDELPATAYKPGYSHELVAVAGYALLYNFGLTPQTATTEPVAPAAPAPAAPKPGPHPARANTDASDNSGEQVREPLAVKLYAKDMVLEFPDGTQKSIHREISLATTSDQEENEIAAFRLRALQHINGLQQPALSTDIWKVIDPPEEHATNRWDRYLGDFFDELSFAGQPLVTVDNSTPRRRFCSPGAFDIQVESVDEASGMERVNYYPLPDGTLLGSREAAMMKLLEKATAENPLTQAAFEASGIVRTDAADGKRPPNTSVSGLAGQLNTKLKNTGFDDLFVIRRGNHPKAKSSAGRPEPVYWLEINQRKAEQLQLNRSIFAVAGFVANNTEFFNNLLVTPVDETKLAAVLDRYTNKKDAAPITREDVITGLKQLGTSEMFEQLADGLAGPDSSAYYLLDILDPLVGYNKDDNPENLQALIETVQEHIAATGKANGEVLHAAKLAEIEAQVRNTCEALVGQVFVSLNDQGMLNPAIPLTVFTVNTAFGTHFKEKEKPTPEQIVLAVVTSSQAFRELQTTSSRQQHVQRGMLEALVKQIHATYTAQ